MEALQLAQMLADLNDLQAAQEQKAAKDLVTANKNLDADTKNKRPGHHSRSLSVQTPSQMLQVPKGAAADSNRLPSPVMGKFDKLGRRIFTPPLTRTNSNTGSSSNPGTPRTIDPDGDIDRASTLLSLYEIRAKLKEQDNSSLMKAREKINALAAKQTQTAKEQQARSAPPTSKDAAASTSRIPYPK